MLRHAVARALPLLLLLLHTATNAASPEDVAVTTPRPDAADENGSSLLLTTAAAPTETVEDDSEDEAVAATNLTEPTPPHSAPASAVVETIDSFGLSGQDATSCPAGHRLAASSGGATAACEDIDECQSFVDNSVSQEEDRRDACGNYIHSHRPGYKCVNTPGSFRCDRIVDCGFGYVLNATLGQCIDINECEILGYEAACGVRLPIKVCINLDGSFRCDYLRCPPGRHLDRVTGKCRPCPSGFAKTLRGTCQDLDECARPADNDCPAHMRCVNFVGGYECKHKIFCPMGRRTNYNGTACVDIDECSEQPGICGLSRDCFNTDGAYRCEPKQCDKTKRLVLETGQCVCVSGYRMTQNSSSCEDINECMEGSHNCDPSDVCRNIRGKFECLSRDKVCQPGFGLSFDHETCVDIDECQLGQYKCGRHEYCNNTHGSYTCLCSSGFQRIGSSKQCTDIDECSQAVANGTGVCRAPFVCANTVGSFACNCPAGYRRSGQACADIDECSERPGVCGPAGRCANRPPGAYTCACPPGYMATDSVGGTCADIDECSLRACPATAKCSNTAGGYDCHCRQGFRFVRDSNECKDIDECQVLASPCEANMSCYNYRGHYSCYRNQCPTGFRISGEGPRQTSNTLSFNCEPTSNGCQTVPGLLGNASSSPLCVRRYRIMHKAQELREGSDEFVKIQSDLRRSPRSCQFRAVLTRGGNASETVHTSDQPEAEFPDLIFEQSDVRTFIICSTKLRLGGGASDVTKIQLEVALIGKNLVEISSNTIHIVKL